MSVTDSGRCFARLAMGLAMLLPLCGCISMDGVTTWPGRETPVTRTTTRLPSRPEQSEQSEGQTDIASEESYKYDPAYLAPADVPLEGGLHDVYLRAREQLVDRHRADAAIHILSPAINSNTSVNNGAGLEYLHLLRGICYAAQGNYRAAKADLTESIKRDGKIWQAYLHRSQVLLAMNDTAGSQQDIDQGKQLAPAGAWINFSPNGKSL